MFSLLVYPFTVPFTANNLIPHLPRLKYDILGEPSSVDPSILCPAEQLQWNISSESARDIDIAKKNIDRYIGVLCVCVVCVLWCGMCVCLVCVLWCVCMLGGGLFPLGLNPHWAFSSVPFVV